MRIWGIQKKRRFFFWLGRFSVGGLIIFFWVAWMKMDLSIYAMASYFPYRLISAGSGFPIPQFMIVSFVKYFFAPLKEIL